VSQILDAASTVYNIAPELGLLLAVPGELSGAPKVLSIINNLANGLSLDNLAEHNLIEHDASLAHDDANGARFAPTTVNQDKVNQLASINPAGLSIDDFAQARVQREAASPPLDSLHNTVAQGESAFMVLIFGGDDGVVPVDSIKQWLGEERLPDGYTRPAEQITFQRLDATAKAIGAAVARIRSDSA
jgi:hypothetical protein